jgi:methionyl-tRNA synthetase
VATNPSDTPFDRQLFVQMLPSQQAAWLTALRERRLAAVNEYHAKVEAIAADKQAKLIGKLERAFDQMKKADDKLQAAMEALDKRLTTMYALVAMAGDTTHEEQRDTSTVEGED